MADVLPIALGIFGVVFITLCLFGGVGSRARGGRRMTEDELIEVISGYFESCRERDYVRRDSDDYATLDGDFNYRDLAKAILEKWED